VIIWTRGYQPFIMGGNVNAPLGTTIEVGELYDLGQGYQGYLVANPKTGTAYVVEAQTGAIIGPDLETVRQDVKEGDPKVMAEQVGKAMEDQEKVMVKMPDDFWGRMK
jgi:hypothetical protein